MKPRPPLTSGSKRRHNSAPQRSAALQGASASPVTHEATRHDEPAPITTGLDEAKEQFLDAKIAQACTERTVDHYRWTVEKFNDWARAQGVKSIDEVTPQLIRKYLTAKIKSRRASSYIHGHARVIRTWFGFLQDEEVISTNPMERVAMPRVERKILPTFSQDDIERLLGVCQTLRERALIMVLIDTGIRASELVHLNLGDVDLQTGRIVVRQGKGRRDRLVFLSPRTVDALQYYLAQRSALVSSAPLFPSAKTGKPLTPNGLLLLCRRLGQRAGVANCHPHTFRRTFATWSLRAGMNIHVVQRFMGHADLDVLLRYLDLGEADLAEAHRLYSPVDSMFARDVQGDQPGEQPRRMATRGSGYEK